MAAIDTKVGAILKAIDEIEERIDNIEKEIVKLINKDIIMKSKKK